MCAAKRHARAAKRHARIAAVPTLARLVQANAADEMLSQGDLADSPRHLI
jgi:hypothetical protein